MNRLSYIAGFATALTVSAGAWGVLQVVQTAKAAPDQSLGMAIMSAKVNELGDLIDGTGALWANRNSTGYVSVLFNRSVQNCTMTASSGNVGFGTPIAAALVTPSQSSASNGVSVFLRKPTDLALMDGSFHLLLFCPR